jgi:hypothetical protein
VGTNLATMVYSCGRILNGGYSVMEGISSTFVVCIPM